MLASHSWSKLLILHKTPQGEVLIIGRSLPNAKCCKTGSLDSSLRSKVGVKKSNAVAGEKKSASVADH